LDLQKKLEDSRQIIKDQEHKKESLEISLIDHNQVLIDHDSVIEAAIVDRSKQFEINK
jgi:hypothetical protein